jgi:ABC-type lipoprotein export system ATPase subunit
MIILKNVSKSYGSIKLLENFSLTVETGRVTCVLGRSGCGKSTLLKLMALIAKPDKGRVAIDGLEIDPLREAEIEEVRNKKIAYSFQEPMLIPYMTAIENVTEIVGVRRDTATDLLCQLGLSSRMSSESSKLSLGEKKRIDLARALLKGSTVLVADEPLSSIDPSTGLKVMELLKAFAKNERTVVYSSVEPSDAKFADIVINM